MTAISVDLKTRAKQAAAERALDFVEDGMTLGLGSGSTAELFIAALGARMSKTGLSVRGIPTSQATAAAAQAAGVPLIPIDRAHRIDLDVDGADEIDPMLNLIKGGGGCLLREKIIAHASDLVVIIADEAKMVDRLGAFALPVEVDPFGFTITAKKVFDALRAAGVDRPDIQLRSSAADTPFVTDGGHYILDCATGLLADPDEAARQLRRVPGVMGHGLFLEMADAVVLGEFDGETVRVIEA